MSGIAAILHFDDWPVDREQIDELMQALVWRGPDHLGSWVNGSVALGVVQLWTTPEEWDTYQPLTTPQGSSAVLDGRIDNRPDLGRALAIPNRDLAAMSDVALLWRAYQKWGLACVDHLAGAYAFIIWDADNRELFCGRDPLGLRSLFYHWDGRRFYAASTLQSLRGLGIWPLTLNDDYIWDYLTTSFTGSYDLAATPFREIQRLPGGQFLRLTEASLDVRRYWKPWELSPLRYKSHEEYAAHLRTLFEEVVAAHCRAVGPIGAALSGGLDSSSIVAVARRMEEVGKLPATALHTFTLVWEGAVQSLSGFTDGSFAAIVNEEYGGSAHYLPCDDMTMFDQIPHRGPVPQDEPNFHIYTPWFNLEQKAKETGIRVLLTGVGAGEGMAGTLFFIVDWLCSGRMRDALWAANQVAESTPHNYGQILFNLVLAGLGPRSLAHFLHKMQPKHSVLSLNTRFHARTVPWLPQNGRLLRRSLARHRLIPKTFKEISDQAQFEAGLLLAGDNTKLWGDQYLGLPAHIDQRYPYYDRRLVEFFLRIPIAQKIGRNGERKVIMRRAMEGILPDAIRLREGNTDYGFVFREGLNHHWAAIQAMFNNSRAAEAGYIDGSAFLKVLKARRFGAENVSDADIIPTLGLEFWLREIEQPVVQAVHQKESV